MNKLGMNDNQFSILAEAEINQAGAKDQKETKVLTY